MKDLQIITENSANDLLQVPLLSEKTRKSLRIPKNKIAARKRKDPVVTGQSIMIDDDDDNEDDLEVDSPGDINVFDTLSFLSTIFEDDEMIDNV